jgi:hypothetical protein
MYDDHSRDDHIRIDASMAYVLSATLHVFNIVAIHSPQSGFDTELKSTASELLQAQSDGLISHETLERLGDAVSGWKAYIRGCIKESGDKYADFAEAIEYLLECYYVLIQHRHILTRNKAQSCFFRILANAPIESQWEGM